MPHYCHHIDEDLFCLVKSGDEKAFKELYNRYWKKLLSRAFTLVHSHNEAEEIVQNTFVQIWKKRDSIEINKTFRSYLLAILQYDCFKVMAKRAKAPQSTSIDYIEKADFSTEQLIEFDSLRDELEKAIVQLPEKCQLIFRLSREGNLSDKEIAQQLHISLNTVRTQKHRALVKLKKIITPVFFV